MSLIIKEESFVEELISKTLEQLGYFQISSFNDHNWTIVINFEKLKEQLMKINKKLEIEYIDGAIEKIKKLSSTFLFMKRILKL